MNHTYDIKNSSGGVSATVVLPHIVSVGVPTDISSGPKSAWWGFEVWLTNGAKLSPCVGSTTLAADHARLLLVDAIEEYHEAVRVSNGGTPDCSARAQLQRAIADRRKQTPSPYAFDCAFGAIEKAAEQARSNRSGARKSALIQAVESEFQDSSRKDEILQEAESILSRFDESSEL